MNTERPFPAPRFLGLLWLGWWLALAWLAGIAWHHEPAPEAKSVTTVATEKVIPPRPAFEDMQAFTADHRFISFEQWSTWLDQSQQALTAARTWGNASYQIKELESNLQLLSVEMLKQQESSRSQAALDAVLFRLSRSNPQLRLYEQERIELERGPADLSRLMLRLFAIPLASETVVPNALAFEAACPVWGELSQSLGQLQNELETSKGRRLDLARRSLSVFEKPDLTATIHAHAKQCAAVIDSRKAVTTLTRALQQVAWGNVFVPQAPVATPQADKSVRAAEPSAHVLARQWMPAALTLALVCTVLLAWSLRVRSRRLAEQWDQLQEHRQRLQSQLHDLRAKLTQDHEPALALAELPPPQTPEVVATAPIIAPPLENSPIPPNDTRAEDLTPIRAALAAASEQLRNIQLGLIQGTDKNQVLQELQYVQALLDQTGRPDRPADGADA